MGQLVYALVLVLMAPHNDVQTVTIGNIASEAECHRTAAKVRSNVKYWIPLNEACVPYHMVKSS